MSDPGGQTEEFETPVMEDIRIRPVMNPPLTVKQRQQVYHFINDKTDPSNE